MVLLACVPDFPEFEVKLLWICGETISYCRKRPNMHSVMEYRQLIVPLFVLGGLHYKKPPLAYYSISHPVSGL